jgi:hypothetical protein
MKVSVSSQSSILHRVPVEQVGVGDAPLETNTAGSFLFKCYLALIFCLSVFSLYFLCC